MGWSVTLVPVSAWDLTVYTSQSCRKQSQQVRIPPSDMFILFSLFFRFLYAGGFELNIFAPLWISKQWWKRYNGLFKLCIVVLCYTATISKPWPLHTVVNVPIATHNWKESDLEFQNYPSMQSIEFFLTWTGDWVSLQGYCTTQVFPALGVFNLLFLTSACWVLLKAWQLFSPQLWSYNTHCNFWHLYFLQHWQYFKTELNWKAFWIILDFC